MKRTISCAGRIENLDDIELNQLHVNKAPHIELKDDKFQLFYYGKFGNVYEVTRDGLTRLGNDLDKMTEVLDAKQEQRSEQENNV